MIANTPPPLALPAPARPAPETKAQKEQRWAERISRETGEALQQIERAQATLDRSLQGADAVLRTLDEARVPLSAVAAQGAADPQAAWSQAQRLVGEAAERARRLGNQVAVDLAGPLQSSVTTVKYAGANLYGAAEGVRQAGKASGERAQATAEALDGPLAVLQRDAARFATQVALAVADMGAPVSKAQAVVALKALDEARFELERAGTHADDLHLGLYGLRLDGGRFRSDVEAALQGATPAKPATYAEELDGMARTLETLPARLHTVDEGLAMGAGPAGRLQKAFYAFTRAQRTLVSADEGQVPQAREEALQSLAEMRRELDQAESVVLGAGPRIVADSLAPLWDSSRGAAERLKALDRELQDKHEETAWGLFFGRQYGRTHEALGEGALYQLPRGIGLVHAGMERGVELPRKFRELRRLVDDSARWTRQDPTLAKPALADNLQKMTRLVRDLNLALPSPDPTTAGLPVAQGSLLGNAARFVSAGLGPLAEAAAVAREHGI